VKTANCPSCGAEVVFRAPASVMAVCGYCRSTLVRTDLALENLGRMAELMDDPTLLQLGVQGVHRGQRFTVIGRIQLQYRQGLWNEWHVLFDQQRAGWLGEASGQYTLSFQVPAKASLPARGSLSPGDKVELAGHFYTVTDLEDGHCVAGEGELPFPVGGGFPASSVDLRSGRGFATLDYSEDPPLLFVGESVAFADLRLSGLRDAPTLAKAQAGTLRCTSCGSPIAISSPGVKSVACGSCHAILDAENPKLKILSRFVCRMKIEPDIPLGTEGRFEEGVFRVIGFMERGTVGPLHYDWREYLLHNPTLGFRWLTESDGHWSWVKPLAFNPTPTKNHSGHPALLYDGTVYRHFSSAKAKASYVVGEFYWKVKVGESALVSDYTAPPRLISEEKSKNEVVWSLAEYLEPKQVRAALGLQKDLKKPQGVAANQPWPHEAAYGSIWRFSWGCLLAALLIQIMFVAFSQNKIVYSTSLAVPPGKAGEAIATDDFRLEGRPGNLLVSNTAWIDNDWVYLDMTLVNRDTGQTFELSREIDYYHGCDDECWSEGGNTDQAVISAVPAGNYYFLIDTETHPNVPHTIHTIYDQFSVKRDVPGWLNFFLSVCGLMLVPFAFFWRRNVFERTRWAESDHPPASGSGGGDDG